MQCDRNLQTLGGGIGKFTHSYTQKMEAVRATETSQRTLCNTPEDMSFAWQLETYRISTGVLSYNPATL